MKNLKILFNFVAVIVMVSIGMLTSCDKNEDAVEIWDYPWYLHPDTGRDIQDGKLYFHPKEPPFGLIHNYGFMTDISGVSIQKELSPDKEHTISVNKGCKWEFKFTLTGKHVTVASDFTEFKNLCKQTGFRPPHKTPYDPELLKLQPIYNWEPYDLCCQSVKYIRIITHRDYDMATPVLSTPAESEMSKYVMIRLFYLDDAFDWHIRHKNMEPVRSGLYPYANFKTLGYFPLSFYNLAPYIYPMNLFSIEVDCAPVKEGDYPLTLVVGLSDGQVFSRELLLKVY